jgi:hypothetical protein
MATQTSRLVVGGNHTATARMQHVIRSFLERKKLKSGDIYDAMDINELLECIGDEASTIDKLCHLAIGELDRRRSANLKLTLETLDLNSRVQDLEYEKSVMFDAIRANKHWIDLATSDVDGKEIINDLDKVAKRCYPGWDEEGPRLRLSNSYFWDEVFF